MAATINTLTTDVMASLLPIRRSIQFLQSEHGVPLNRTGVAAAKCLRTVGASARPSNLLPRRLPDRPDG